MQAPFFSITQRLQWSFRGVLPWAPCVNRSSACLIRPETDTNTRAVPRPQDNQIRAALSIMLVEEAALASLPTRPYPALGSQRSSTNQAYHNMVDMFGRGAHQCACTLSIFLIGHTPSLVVIHLKKSVYIYIYSQTHCDRLNINETRHWWGGGCCPMLIGKTNKKPWR